VLMPLISSTSSGSGLASYGARKLAGKAAESITPGKPLGKEREGSTGKCDRAGHYRRRKGKGREGKSKSNCKSNLSRIADYTM
jgi:hypothetical protein